MKTVENMPEDIPCNAHTNERMAHRAELEVIRDIAWPADGRVAFHAKNHRALGAGTASSGDGTNRIL